MVHTVGVNAMSKVSRGGPGRPKGALNKITRDIRAVLRDLAEGNAENAQKWLDRVAKDNPAEAVRLFLALCRFVTPVLAAAAIADLTPPKSTRDDRIRLARMTDEELMEVIVQSPEAAELVRQGVKTKDELLRRIAAPVTAIVPAPTAELSADELLR